MIPFVKMHGIGNDFVMLDLFGENLSLPPLPELSRAMNDRRKGIGGDGLILLERGQQATFRMRMFNPDGSESEMCGNGIRCFAKLAKDRGYLEGCSADVETGAGRLVVEILDDGQVRVDMGLAILEPARIGMIGATGENFIDQPLEGFGLKGTAVSMGNPHLVVFSDDVDSIDLEEIGPKLELHPLFPKKTNVHFIEVLSRTHLKQRTWERGAGITLACGTGACASAVSAALNGLSKRQVNIDLPGGRLNIDYKPDGKVLMTGPAETVFSGAWSLN